MKKILFGLCYRAARNRDKIRLWAESFRRVSDAEIVLLNANAKREDIWACESLGIRHVEVEVHDTRHINHKRLRHMVDFMEGSDADLFLVTDVFDVAFQGDPFLKMDLDNYDIFVSGEGVMVDEEPWNADNVNKLFPGEGVDSEVLCSGVVAGRKGAMVRLYRRMFELCEAAPDAHEIRDQAALIVMASRGEIERLKVFNLDDGWAMHCAVAGPTPFFEGWGFKDKIRYGIPRIQGGVVLTSDGRPYDIVHQFNRVPLWHDAISERKKDDSCVVVSSYHRTLEGEGNRNIRRFVGHGLRNFFVLFDNQMGMDCREVSDAYGSSVCLYDDGDFARLGFDRPIDTRHRWGNHQNPKYFYAHFRMLVFYLKNPGFKHYWFFDDDVSFDGDLGGLLDSYERSDDDFIAIQAFKGDDYPDLHRVSRMNSRMLGSHGRWLDLCPGPGDRFNLTSVHVGSFFPVVRFSNAALDHLFKVHLGGFYGYSEGFVPTSLASAGFNVASMMDEFDNFFLDSGTDCVLYHKGGRFTWEWL